MGVFIIIGLLAMGTAALCYTWRYYDEKLCEWENRKIVQLKNWKRKKRRDLCAKWLAEDGMVATVRLASNEDVIAPFGAAICLRRDIPDGAICQRRDMPYGVKGENDGIRL